jgi:DNA-binding NarL/FixJ family response regulator
MTTNPVLDRQLQTGKKTVLVVDDHPLMRQGLALLINQQQDMQVCGEAEEAQAAMHAIAQLRPDIMILDISLNGPDGLDILKNIRATNPDLPVLILSMHDEANIRRTCSPRPSQRLHHEAGSHRESACSRAPHPQWRGLPQRAHVQQDAAAVYRLIGEGRGTREIAEELHLSIKTVETYQAHIKEKLALRSGRELIQHAIQWKIGE